MAVMVCSGSEPRSNASESISETMSKFIGVHFDRAGMLDTLPLFLAQANLAEPNQHRSVTVHGEFKLSALERCSAPSPAFFYDLCKIPRER